MSSLNFFRRRKASTTGTGLEAPPAKRTRVEERPSESLNGERDAPVEFPEFERHTYEPDESQDILFQLLECEDASKDSYPSANPIQSASSPLIRLFGCTPTGHSICVFLTDFYPYLYFPITPTFTYDDIPAFLDALAPHISKITITTTEIIQDVVPLMYYRDAGQGGNEPARYGSFLKLQVQEPVMVGRLAKILEGADELEGVREWFGEGKLYDVTVYEWNLTAEMRVMVDTGMVGGGWVTIPGNKYRHVEQSQQRPSRCQIQVVCRAADLAPAMAHSESSADDTLATKSDTRHAEIAPLRVLCMLATNLIDEYPDSNTGNDSPKPQATRSKKRNSSNTTSAPSQPIAPHSITGFISCLTTTSHTLTASSNDTTLIFAHSTTPERIRSPSNSHSSRVLMYPTERAMLSAFQSFLNIYDPDVVTGYDVSEQIMGLMDRAERLKVPKWGYLGRLPHLKAKGSRKQIYGAGWVRAQRRMAGTSNREFKILELTGRIVLDMRQIIERDERLPTYSFAEAIQLQLQTSKEVLSTPTLTALWLESPETRRRVVDYLNRDVRLCMQLVRKSAALISYLEMARVTGLNISDTFHRGQMIRFWSQLFRYCKKIKTVIPTRTDRNEGQMTEGPLNIAPVAQYNTKDPIAVLDFRSLYPSIIIAHNLSYDTLLMADDRPQLEETDYEKGLGPIEAWFVKSHLKKGVVPAILEHFLDERRKVKKRMEETTDPTMKIVLHGRQQALKVSANAIYGFTGARESKLQCLPIAETTILYGATMLGNLIKEIEKTFTKANGFAVDCKVVYGDTDSVFVQMPNTSVQDAIKYGKQIAEKMSELWPDPIQLEFEKVYFPYILINRKRYAGLQWTRPDRPDKIDAKGIESQRRDSIPILGTLMTNVLKILFPRGKTNNRELATDCINEEERQRHITTAAEYVRWCIGRILKGEYDIGEFISTKGTETEDYQAKQIHVELVERIRKRQPWRTFQDGERIPFVYTTGGTKGHEKSQDPLYALQNGLGLDYLYYVRHQIENQLTRIFELLLPPSQVTALFTGDHTRVGAGKPEGAAKGIATFFQTPTTASCLGCRKKVPVDRAVCDDCVPLIPSIYHRLVTVLNDIQRRNVALHAISRQAQKSRAWPVLCENSDSDIFWKRAKAVRDQERAAADVLRLEADPNWLAG
ncbi:DNA-directed DNA polymerase [Spizellomyces sp. 'palustris']|nr:DNA-directed DNA polymerase [Spizellomyces sp. 'palustris']